MPEIDYRLAFEHAPVGMVVSSNRTIVACNVRVCEIFGATPSALVGHSFSILYPSVAEFERIGKRMEPFLNASGHYADNRMMKRLGGLHGAIADETFWCHVTGHALNRDAPHEAGIWTFEDLGSRRAVKAELTPREREVAAQVMRGLTSKEIGKALGISHRTVELHRARLMRKYAAATTAELVQKLIAG
ncbi:MAG TPA: LuxR C-terminal-related transcriptional regulator [Variovorax sp.]|jgi:PAS domain S-box-containing protein|uniref:LuxR C-terminal-related transcriptional regulator n=1 Tax=unclassified Variovorax TaxID=663243 RepID=UPI000F7EDE31|nr:MULTISPECIES: LuxR C-terminal-related transcriptional regulator [unclassified Variovorax]RSZ33238.1 PAS domain-containing protein [Variovorax sp. 553]RSZ33610.1 PAS domain-containing protein [Variovorax sp. 679]